MNNKSAIAKKVRSYFYKSKCSIDTGIIITNSRNFIALEKTALYHGCYILNNHGWFFLGKESHLGAMCYVNCNYGKINIGNNVAIGPGTKLFTYSNYYSKEDLVTNSKICKDIIVGNNVFIGANCIILPGITIGDNCVVAAGSVVNRDLDSNCVYGGVPVHKIKDI